MGARGSDGVAAVGVAEAAVVVGGGVIVACAFFATGTGENEVEWSVAGCQTDRESFETDGFGVDMGAALEPESCEGQVTPRP